MQSTSRSVIINLCILASCLAALFAYLVLSGKWSVVLRSFSTLNPWYLGIACLCMLAYLALETCSLHVALKLSNIKLSWIRLVSTSMVGQFFGNITPFQSGAQPAQAASLALAGLDIARAASALLSKFIAYQAGLTIFAALMLFFKLDFFKQAYGNLALIAILGFGIHVVVLLGLFFAGISPKLLESCSLIIIKVLARLRIIKDASKYKRKMRKEIRDFCFSFGQLKHHKTELFYIILITFLQLIAFYLIPYFVLRALGLEGLDVLVLIAAAAFVLLIATSVPLPGGSGGAEGSFAVFLGLFTQSSELMLSALILWRLISFYGPTVVSAPFVGILRRKQKKAAS